MRHRLEDRFVRTTRSSRQEESGQERCVNLPGEYTELCAVNCGETEDNPWTKELRFT